MSRAAAWELSDEDRRVMRRLNSTLGLFRVQDAEMPLQQMIVFCWVALNEGKTQRELCDALKMATSTSSRNIAALSPVHRLGKPGLGLVTWVDSPTDRRAKLLMLTDKGRAFAEQVSASLL